ncbi:hypothetical protein PR003_g33378 [Phytophthora rubi]|uniref:Uncharacterized protein n=1 Tax=Phytophthora rubi TaxID=129364 RepID=A0A6A4AXJ4_9STRA|nr:hypothetical protein PR003_g33378 [Phytophthora rubi]
MRLNKAGIWLLAWRAADAAGHCSRTSANPQPVCCSRDSGPVRLVLGRRCWPY